MTSGTPSLLPSWRYDSPPRAAASGGWNITTRTGAKATDANLDGQAPKATGVSVRTNRVKANTLGGMSDLKPGPAASSIATGTKSMTPNSRVTLVASTTKVPTQGQIVNQVASATGMIAITKGQRLPNLSSFAVVFNSQFVDFDVQPRVDEGVPMTPFRHLLEKAGGTVDWENLTKSVKAKAEGKDIFFQIGDKNAKINSLTVSLETAPYLDRGRTIVPLTFLSDALDITIEYDKETGHVLITSKKQ